MTPEESEDYLFQFWIRTQDGWQLLWLNKILDPVAQDYGRRDTGAIRGNPPTLPGRNYHPAPDWSEPWASLSATRRLSCSATGTSDRAVSLTGRKVLWLTREEIAARSNGQNWESFYVDVQPIRVLKRIAIGTFDVIPCASSRTTIDGPGASSCF